MTTKGNFVLSPRYKTVLKTPSEARAWVKSVKLLPFAEKIEAMRTTFLMLDFTPFWETGPDTEEYRDLVRTFFADLRGLPYDIQKEAVADTERQPANVYPYSTKSNNAVAENMIGIGSILKGLPFPAPANILEMGCGWANSALTMARTGYTMTCVDIDPTCGDVIDYWAPRLLVEDRIRFVKSTFEDIETSAAADQRYDAIVFFKSFHHCLYPVELLKACHNLLRPGGALLLVAEPIHGNFYVPWGLRCDGTSVFAIVNNGWMELGFDTAFFDETTREIGFTLAKRQRSPDNPTFNYDLFTRGLSD